jgi:rhamnosyltransferase
MKCTASGIVIDERGPPAMTAEAGGRICALVVTFEPDAELLRRMLAAVAPQVDHLLLVDNASGQFPPDPFSTLARTATTLLRLPSNLGLAAAQNQGMAWIIEHGFEFALLLDQDSVAEPGMVDALKVGLLELDQPTARVAAVGPVYVDARTGQGRHFVRFSTFNVRRAVCGRDNDRLEVDFLIASGSLLRTQTYGRIGRFEDGLFIDNIDLEWCFRARDRGYRLFGICHARMQHALGDDVIRVWMGRWWYVYRHGPLRQYYMARNRVALYRRPYSPRGWIIQDSLRFLVKLFWFGLVFSPRLKNLQMIWRGTRDGLRNRMGPYRH